MALMSNVPRGRVGTSGTGSEKRTAMREVGCGVERDAGGVSRVACGTRSEKRTAECKKEDGPSRRSGGRGHAGEGETALQGREGGLSGANGSRYTLAAAFLPARRPNVSAVPRLMPATTTG